VKITRGIEQAPVRTVVYGEPGVGKSTFAAQAPGVVFVDLEGGTTNLDVARARTDAGEDPKTLPEVSALLDALGNEPNVQNVAIDTLDALEALVHAHVCKVGGKSSLEAFGYGKGYQFALEQFRLVMGQFERLNRLGKGVILLAHAKVSTFANPEGANFDRYDLKLHKLTAPAVVEWAHNVLFARREQYALEENGKVRGVGTSARFVHTVCGPAYVAKNRFSLPEKLPLAWSDYAAAMKAKTPGDPEEMRVLAVELIEKFDPDTAAKAHAAMAKLTTPAELARFIDHCRSKLEVYK
jgi:hypothetical protein